MKPVAPDRWSAIRRTVLACVIAAVAAEVAAAPAGEVDFARDIRPVISGKCYHCHGPDEESRKAKLRLDQRDDAVRDRKGTFAIKPGDPEASELIRRIVSTDPDDVMPPPKTGHTISPEELALLKKWIAQGAKYAGHWAFTKPVRVEAPQIKRVAGQDSISPSWHTNPLDRFVAAKILEAGLKPSPEADRATLIRRVSLDLTGLPPTPLEIDAYLRDTSPNAYEKVVDRLLASPRYGERWARIWLDLARYADSAGYGSDPLRLNIWPYRDWLIDALNRNLPYDEFTRDQLAGDLLPDATEEQRVATAFHRNTMTNTEGGTDDEEWRVAAVKDRANVTAQAWMGLTMGCAQCHTHKFDPISHKEYYSFFAFFNQSADNDQPDESPTMPVYSASERRERARLSKEIAGLEEKFRASNSAYDAELAAWTEAAAKPVRWSVLKPETVSSVGTNGASLSILSDGSVLASGGLPERDAYRVQVRAMEKGITAFRLEALPDESLPNRGPGRTPNDGNFVLNDFRVEVSPAEATRVSARYVRVEAPGKSRILSLAEVQIFSRGENVAGRGTATQSSTGYLGDAGRAIDGNTDGDYDNARSTTHTNGEDDPWWEVDLGREFPIEELGVWNRTDGAGDRLAGSRVRLIDSSRRVVWEGDIKQAPSPMVKVGPSAARPLALRNASADYSQDRFPVASAIDSDPGRRSGWAVGGRIGVPHSFAAELAEPIPGDGPHVLTFTLAHNYGGRQTLGRFRISATTQASPVRVHPAEVQSALDTPVAQCSPEQRRAIDDHFRPQSKTFGPMFAQIAASKRDLGNIRGVPLPVMRELAGEQKRVSHLLNKGNFLDPGETVEAVVPAAFNPMPKGAPANRLGLAAWLTDVENPLTARVAVNRFWSALFGVGIVETEEDFGTQGSLPSHPELLDWLAVEFMSPSDPAAHPWDMKRMLRTLVTSGTYRQSAKVPATSLEKDPRNRLLSHYPRRRLDAEMVRDQALAVSGLLSEKVGGPSVYPVQPEGIWRAAFNGERSYTVSEGEDRYRRGLYTVWRRTVPYPSMATFDAPSRETCTFRRQPTNTPLQAYVTLNDPVFLEAAQALGRRIEREGGDTIAERLRYGLRVVTGRQADEVQVAQLAQLFESMRIDFASKPEEALKFATKPLGPLSSGTDAASAAAWTAVANVLLNLDATLTKG
jgi:mono/diheme cytochrome c family protein